MDTVTKAAQEPRSTERLVEALSTLAVLLERTINEVRALDADFQNRLLEVTRETEELVQSRATERLQRAVADAEQKVRKETTDLLNSQFEIDMRAALSAVRGEMEEEFRKSATEMSTQWEEHRRNLHADLDRANQVASDAQAVNNALAEKVRTTPSKTGLDVETMTKEVERVETLIAQISSLMEDPAVELSTIIRKNVERAELESYLKGIRFALGR